MMLCCCCADDPKQEVITDKVRDPAQEVFVVSADQMAPAQRWDTDAQQQHAQLLDDDQKSAFLLPAPPAVDKVPYSEPIKEHVTEPPQPVHAEPPAGPSPGPIEVKQEEQKVEDNSTFSVEVTKGPEGGAGLEVEAYNGMLLCAKLREGPVMAWNRENGAEKRVSAGDRIIEVNGVQGEPSSMIQALRDGSRLRVLLRHPLKFEVKLAKRDGKGFGIALVSGGKLPALKVTKLGPGAVADWNSRNADKEIKVGDRITAVNDIQTDAQAMLAQLKETDTVKMAVLRPY